MNKKKIVMTRRKSKIQDCLLTASSLDFIELCVYVLALIDGDLSCIIVLHATSPNGGALLRYCIKEGHSRRIRYYIMEILCACIFMPSSSFLNNDPTRRSLVLENYNKQKSSPFNLPSSRSPSPHLAPVLRISY